MRKKKEEPQVIETVEKPHHSFCKNCTNIDTRLLKDTINMAVLTINLMVDELGFDATNFESKCKKLRTWAGEQKVLRTRRESKNAERKSEKTAAKTAKKRHRKPSNTSV